MLARWNRRMYSVICKNQNAIISAIDPQDVQEYESLVSRIGQANNSQYQKEYKTFWIMHRAHLGPGFDQAYFSALHHGALNPTQPIPALSSLCQMLYQFPRLKGDQALQFSFATKLRHMLNRHLPIYDDNIAGFYLFQKPYWLPATDLKQRINALMVFQNFLISEYKRILGNGLLQNPIAAFKRQFKNPARHTDVKIIDWLILNFVTLAEKKKINW
jgi:hypothetical protein